MQRKKKILDSKSKAPATAAGQALGYSVQFTRLTALLLNAPIGSVCSLEVLDDVAELRADGTITLSQSKSALTSNPAANRSISFWKTIYNWLSLVKDGFVDPEKAIFEFYVTKPVRGELIEGFDHATSIDDANLALDKAREELWGTAPNFPKRKQLSEELDKYAASIFEAAPMQLLPIIVNMRLTCGSGSPQGDIEAAIRRGPVSESRVFEIADKMCGWVKREVDKQLEKAIPATIRQEDFHKEYVSYVRRVDREQILKSLAGKPSDAEKVERLPDTFVQQLELIDFDYDSKLEAIGDFLRACSDRTKWSETGDVHEDSFAELDDNLLRAWRNLGRTAAIEAADKTVVEHGQLLHSACMGHQAKVQGMEPPSHFVPGCFHRLADELVVGWHPEYRTILAEKLAKAS